MKQRKRGAALYRPYQNFVGSNVRLFALVRKLTSDEIKQAVIKIDCRRDAMVFLLKNGRPANDFNICFLNSCKKTLLRNVKTILIAFR
ncbi:MAG TPA: hypothetical protein PLG94_11890 [Smithellaceae bacterium]|nr:hypothetical protein [Smithellaceae bacterium]